MEQDLQQQLEEFYISEEGLHLTSEELDTFSFTIAEVY